MLIHVKIFISIIEKLKFEQTTMCIPVSEIRKECFHCVKDSIEALLNSQVKRHYMVYVQGMYEL